MKTALLSHENTCQKSQNNLAVDQVQSQILVVLQNLLQRDWSEHTKQAIVSDIKCFATWYVQKNCEYFNLYRLVERDIIDYRRESQASGHAPATINRRLVHLKLFCDEAIALGEMKVNPVVKVKQLPLQSLAPKGLTTAELRRFLKEVEIRGNLRDRVIIELMVGAGLRASEVVALNISDISISEKKGSAKVRNSKGNKSRLVPLNNHIRSLLSEFITQCRPSENLFTGQRWLLTPLCINAIVSKYARKADVGTHPHAFRHTFALNYLRANPSDLVGLSQMLGHSNINTTAIYTQNRLEDLQTRVEEMTY